MSSACCFYQLPDPMRATLSVIVLFVYVSVGECRVSELRMSVERRAKVVLL